MVVGGVVIPGTFYAWDRLPVLFGFVRESLVDGWQPFELIAPGSQKLQDSDEAALAECNLVSLSHLVESFGLIQWSARLLRSPPLCSPSPGTQLCRPTSQQPEERAPPSSNQSCWQTFRA